MRASTSILTLLLAAASPTLGVNPLVDLIYTQIRGTALPLGVTQWLGVRYAAAPVGEARFRAPANAPFTTGVQDATRVSDKLKLR
jgi:hypothetical protein